MTPIALSLLLLQPAVAPAKADAYTETYAKVSRLIQSMHWDRARRKEAIEQRLAAWKDRAVSAATREAFADTVNRMIAEFGESHFGFFTDATQTYYTLDGLVRQDPEPMPHVGAWFVPAQDGYTITMLIEGAEAVRAGLREGDVITKIDGAPFSPIASLRGKEGRSPAFTVRRGDRTFESKMEVKATPGLDLFLEGTRNSARIIEQDSRKIGYVHLWTMANERFRDTLHGLLYGRLRGAEAVVLDLRDGFGGRYEGYGDPFFRPNVDIAQGPMSGRFGFAGVPLVLITNEGTRSAKEVFSEIMKQSGRATLVGRTTAGAVLGTTPLKVEEWAYLLVPIMELSVGGNRIEGKGVTPHIALDREYGSDGTDLFLEKAVSTAVKSLDARGTGAPSR